MPAAVEADLGPICARAVIEVVIGDVIIRAGVDADEAHLSRVIRVVRSA